MSNYPKKKHRKKKGSIVLFVIEILILAALVAGIFIYARINQGLRNIGASSASTATVSDENQNTDDVKVNSAATVDKVMCMRQGKTARWSSENRKTETSSPLTCRPS